MEKLEAILSRVANALEERTQTDRQLVEAIEANTAALERLQSQPDNPQRATISEAAAVLGIQTKAIRDRINSGYYRQGKEAFDVSLPDAKQAAWRLDVNACFLRDAELQKKRQKRPRVA